MHFCTAEALKLQVPEAWKLNYLGLLAWQMKYLATMNN